MQSDDKQNCFDFFEISRKIYDFINKIKKVEPKALENKRLLRDIEQGYRQIQEDYENNWGKQEEIKTLIDKLDFEYSSALLKIPRLKDSASDNKPDKNNAPGYEGIYKLADIVNFKASFVENDEVDYESNDEKNIILKEGLIRKFYQNLLEYMKNKDLQKDMNLSNFESGYQKIKNINYDKIHLDDEIGNEFIDLAVCESNKTKFDQNAQTFLKEVVNLAKELLDPQKNKHINRLNEESQSSSQSTIQNGSVKKRFGEKNDNPLFDVTSEKEFNSNSKGSKKNIGLIQTEKTPSNQESISRLIKTEPGKMNLVEQNLMNIVANFSKRKSLPERIQLNQGNLLNSISDKKFENLQNYNSDYFNKDINQHLKSKEEMEGGEDSQRWLNEEKALDPKLNPDLIPNTFMMEKANFFIDDYHDSFEDEKVKNNNADLKRLSPEIDLNKIEKALPEKDENKFNDEYFEKVGFTPFSHFKQNYLPIDKINNVSEMIDDNNSNEKNPPQFWHSFAGNSDGKADDSKKLILEKSNNDENLMNWSDFMKKSDYLDENSPQLESGFSLKNNNVWVNSEDPVPLVIKKQPKEEEEEQNSKIENLELDFDLLETYLKDIEDNALKNNQPIYQDKNQNNKMTSEESLNDMIRKLSKDLTGDKIIENNGQSKKLVQTEHKIEENKDMREDQNLKVKHSIDSEIMVRQNSISDEKQTKIGDSKRSLLAKTKDQSNGDVNPNQPENNFNEVDRKREISAQNLDPEIIQKKLIRRNFGSDFGDNTDLSLAKNEDDNDNSLLNNMTTKILLNPNQQIEKLPNQKDNKFDENLGKTRDLSNSNNKKQKPNKEADIFKEYTPSFLSRMKLIDTDNSKEDGNMQTGHSSDDESQKTRKRKTKRKYDISVLEFNAFMQKSQSKRLVRFIDSDFPPILSSIKLPLPSNSKIEWRRISDIFDENYYFDFSSQFFHQAKPDSLNKKVATFLELKDIPGFIFTEGAFFREFNKELGKITVYLKNESTDMFLDDFVPILLKKVERGSEESFQFLFSQPVIMYRRIYLFGVLIEKFIAKKLGGYSAMKNATFSELAPIFFSHCQKVDVSDFRFVNEKDSRFSLFFEQLVRDFSQKEMKGIAEDNQGQIHTIENCSEDCVSTMNVDSDEDLKYSNRQFSRKFQIIFWVS